MVRSLVGAFSRSERAARDRLAGTGWKRRPRLQPSRSLPPRADSRRGLLPAGRGAGRAHRGDAPPPDVVTLIRTWRAASTGESALPPAQTLRGVPLPEPSPTLDSCRSSRRDDIDRRSITNSDAVTQQRESSRMRPPDGVRQQSQAMSSATSRPTHASLRWSTVATDGGIRRGFSSWIARPSAATARSARATTRLRTCLRCAATATQPASAAVTTSPTIPATFRTGGVVVRVKP